MATKWYHQIGNKSDMVISTRIRFARNLAHFPFPGTMTNEQCSEVVNAVCDAASQISGLSLNVIHLSDCKQREILSMIERHLISYDFAKRPEGVLLISNDERISIMINEEDHVRIQVMEAGLNLEKAYSLADLVDTALNERLGFAFDKRLGYLTQCPTNLGTGMRASLMLHLPALHESGAVQQLAGTISKLGLALRGFYGEGSLPHGAVYQISNQVTLGISEKSAIENLQGISEHIMKQEQLLREKWHEDPALEDRVWRSYGILQTARILSYEETLGLLSNLRIGVCTGMIPNVSKESITRLMIDSQPGCIMTEYDCDIQADKRDQYRASWIRHNLSVI